MHRKNPNPVTSWDRGSVGRRALFVRTSTCYMCWFWVGRFASAGLRTLPYSAEPNSPPVGKGKAADTAWSISRAQSRMRRCSVPWDAPLTGAPYSSAKSCPRAPTGPTAGQVALGPYLPFRGTRHSQRHGCNPGSGSAVRYSASWRCTVPAANLNSSKEQLIEHVNHLPEGVFLLPQTQNILLKHDGVKHRWAAFKKSDQQFFLYVTLSGP